LTKFPLAIAVAALVSATPALAQNQVLNVYNWSDYIAEDTVANFDGGDRDRGQLLDVYSSNDEIVDAKRLAPAIRASTLSYPQAIVPRAPDRGRAAAADRQAQSSPTYVNLDRRSTSRRLRAGPGQRLWRALYEQSPSAYGYNVASRDRNRLGADAAVDSWDVLFEPENAAKLADPAASAVLDSALPR
jgi:putrescine transport system substrate-binding protein